MFQGLIVSGSVFADQNEGPAVPKGVEDPVSDPAKQAKTEEMLKAEEKGLSGDQGGEMPSEVKVPASDAEAPCRSPGQDGRDAQRGSGSAAGSLIERNCLTS